MAIREDLREKGIDPFTVNGAGKLKIKHLDPLLKWKLGVATLPIDVKQSVATRHQKWLEVMNTEVPLGTASDEVGWSDTDEERLQDLKNKAITIKDTGLERERKKQANECCTTVSAESPATKTRIIWQRCKIPLRGPSNRFYRRSNALQDLLIVNQKCKMYFVACSYCLLHP